MPNLTGVTVEFDTHNQGKDLATVVHVFVKNRLNNTQGFDGNTDFISNLLASQRYFDQGDLGDHAGGPYLAYGIGLGGDQEFDDGSHKMFDLTLMPDPISLQDIILPAVDIHILTHGNSRWIFDYTLNFSFDDNGASDFSYSSKGNGGLPGITLDQDNRDYYSICAENPRLPLPVQSHPTSKSFLRKVTVDIFTHDDDKNDDSKVDIEILNRLSASSFTTIAAGMDLFPGQHFDDRGPVKSVHWPSDDGNLTLNEIMLADVVLPVVNITMRQSGTDRWIFDYEVKMEFADPNDFQEKSVFYSWRTSGVILDQDNNKHSGAYRGPGFPSVAARPAAPLTPSPDPIARSKRIPMAVLRGKLDEFINNRNGTDSESNPPLRRIRLHNAGQYNPFAEPESYADVRSIVAGRETVNYVSSPTSLGQISLDGVTDLAFLQDINSDALTITIDDAQPPVLTLEVHFETGGPVEVTGLITQDYQEFSITLKLMLVPAPGPHGSTVVDVLHWITELEDLQTNRTFAGQQTGTGLDQWLYSGTLLGQQVSQVSTATAYDLFIDDLIHVHLVSDGGEVQHLIRTQTRDHIFGQLTSKDSFSGLSPRDSVNSMATSWLLGGIGDDDVDVDGHNTVLTDIQAVNEAILITYTGPHNVFVPPTPSDWPTKTSPNPAWNFSPGTLSNIQHIVVLTMENRSFDHMLGYLSLPVAQGGGGRTDVDGLKGTESNSFRGTTFPSAPVTDTFFSPFPPHGFEPVHRSVNGGLMDGFAAEYAAQNGAAIAGRIMGHQMASTVPAYDSLARDFAIGHRWFAAHPGPTFVNRFYELTGRPNLDPRGFWEFDNSGPLRPVFTKTIFDYLSDPAFSDTGEAVSWTYFEQGYCFLRFFEKYTFDNEHVVNLHDPDRGFFALAKAGTLPSVSFIDPHFVELPPGSNDDDSPSDIKDGQAFVRSVVEAVVAGPAWGSTLLVIIYDEHGGFYDHVPPSVATKVSPELPIETHGVRVPSLVISPWVGAGVVFGSDAAPVAPQPKQRNDQNFDHTSILRTIARRFMSKNPPYLGARYAAANDLSTVVGNVKRQTQFLPFLRYNFRYRTSQQMLAVKDASPAPGAALWQLPVDGTSAQDFAFEDAGNGLWYIRSLVSNLYLTVQAPTASATLGGPGPVPQPIPPGVSQQPKVVPGTASASTTTATTSTEPTVDLPAVARQKWGLRQVAATVGPDLFLIGSESAPGMVLQPADPAQSGAVVLRTIPLGTPPETFAWTVTSPAISH